MGTSIDKEHHGADIAGFPQWKAPKGPAGVI
jgi:hypothetical protein